LHTSNIYTAQYVNTVSDKNGAHIQQYTNSVNIELATAYDWVFLTGCFAQGYTVARLYG